MTYRIYGAFIASLGAATLLLASPTFAASGAAQGARMAPKHPTFRSAYARPNLHPRRFRGAGFWGADGDYYGASDGEPIGNVPPASADIHHTYTYDVPWDWAHRYPPAVAPSDRAYVTECPAQTVIVPGASGEEHAVNIVRCY
jgi:hypothetical protein